MIYKLYQKLFRLHEIFKISAYIKKNLLLPSANPSTKEKSQKFSNVVVFKLKTQT